MSPAYAHEWPSCDQPFVFIQFTEYAIVTEPGLCPLGASVFGHIIIIN